MKTILITGATGYFGKYLVNYFSTKYQVIATSRSMDKLNATFPDAKVIKADMDVYDLAACEKKLGELCKTFDIYGLINNAYDFSTKTGFNSPEGRLETLSIESMKSAMDSGLLAPMLFTKVVGNQMVQKKIKGSIINISSMYGIVAPDSKLYEGKKAFNPLTYGVTKAGINGLTRYVASFWGAHGIRCNSVAPGAFPNTESASANATKDEEFLKRLENKTSLGRVGHPKDLLGLMELLLSENSSYITGQVMSVDGGWTAI
jgi:NAD(P)-dependent dehydrogenase (short-subunit alcohol dehydrogenase family)